MKVKELLKDKLEQFGIRRCDKCREDRMFSTALFAESMKHWGDPRFEEKSFSHVYTSGEIDGIKLVLKIEVFIIAGLLLIKAMPCIANILKQCLL